ncbi:phospholipid-transporting ATPase 1 [Coffea eugenioides]|uniref:Phospholipid-transporting ATPase n=1 Tax=Coffea arabica TaxID=13443 RepID=A0A6P6WGJ1_COFAR|nr:phospholipid-transporting ATPase 1 [Coffea eugenioides]XP_027162114.1 phospholipid-transporting ATPase 1 [Coffea eugenioides]
MTTQQRPLLIPSPRTPGAPELPYTPAYADQLKSISENPKPSSGTGMDINSQVDNLSLPDNITLNSSSQRSNSSYQSRASGRNSMREVSFAGNSVRELNSGELGKKPMRYGSRAESEGLSMSQKEINDEDARFVYINDPVKTNERFEFARNSIRTAKYSIITFLPRNVFEQFHRVAYIYFLVIAILNQLPQLAVFGRGVSVLPLAFVLSVTAVKDAYEDFRRHRSDKIENNRLAWVLVNDNFQQKKWKDIQVGEIIKISANDSLPCDMVLLSTSDPTGVAYVQTINLDGESNLKTRYAKQETQMKNLEKEKISGLIKCEKPNRNIYGFQANMEIDGKRVSLGPSNIVLRGCELKNTRWAIGVAVYAGRETKAMLNSSGAPSKRSRLETQMNREIIILSFFLVALCTIVSVCAGVWLRRHKDELDNMPFYRKKDYSEVEADGNYDDYNYYGYGLEIFFTFLMSVIVFQVMIPISLYISMELVRVGQAYFMIRDTNMYDASSNSRFQCRALNINEDLGQIKYVFSDKTGTLTENKMEFHCASISGVDYNGGTAIDEDEQVGYSAQVDGQVLRPKMKVKVDPQLLSIAKSGKQADQESRVRDFFLALAACNTIVPLTTETADPAVRLVDYQGESPDEQALVYAAAAYGFMLIERTSGHIVIDVQGETHRFNVLGLHEFDSDRKRMSVILGCPDNSVKVFVKGADTSMFSVIDNSLNLDILGATEAHLHSYSSVGLRTLVIGMRELSASEFEQWQSSYETASTALIGRAALLRKVASNVESNLRILGASGIEDKLQQGVPEAIESLRMAGIKVWVLTGDKQETAISIGYSSKLLTTQMTQIVINCKSKESCRKSLDDALIVSQKLVPDSVAAHATGGSSEASPLALIIDGTSLVHILDSELEEQLFQLASRCNVVLCCRVAPLQKAGIVALIKNRTDDMTLAIGDGANDVSMIQMADVGIGISGQEGRQAVMASDFAMGQFRFLVPLLLVHGHWNYQRISYMILYNFYRNAVLVFVLFWYALFTSYTLTTAMTDWSSMLYSIIYTAVPTIVVGILDKDLSRRTLLKYPQLYGAGQREEGYNTTLFWVTMMDTVWQSAAIFFLPVLAYWRSTVDISGLGDLWTLAVVIVVNLHLAMDVLRWYWITHAAIWGSIIATFICVMIIDCLPSLFGYWAFFKIAGSALFWLCLLGITVAALLPRFIVKVFSQYYRPDDILIAREADKFGNLTALRNGEIELNPIFDPPRR